jgi:hypothetical protein
MATVRKPVRTAPMLLKAFFHLELVLCHENGLKIVSFGLRRQKNGRFLPIGDISLLLRMSGEKLA